MNIAEDLSEGKRYLANDCIQKLFNPQMEKDENLKFLLETA